MAEQMIIDQIFALGGQANMGSMTLSNPRSDLMQAGRATGPLEGHSDLPVPRIRMGGPLGKLERSSSASIPAPFNDILGDMSPPMFNHEQPINVSHPVSRLSKPMAPDIPSPSRDELVFYKQDDPRNNRVLRVDNCYLQANAMSYVNPAQWNAISIGEQMAIYNKDPVNHKEYYALTPKELFFPWRLEGIVEQNGQGTRSDLFTKSIRNNQPLCILTKGHSSVNSYWPDAEPGDDLYIVIKKMVYNPNFVLNTKENNSATGAGHRVMQNHLPFRPYQMGFYASRAGGVLPSAVYEYLDDHDTKRSDAHIIKVGTLHFKAGGVAKFDNSRVLNDHNMECELHAYVNSNEGLSRNNYQPQKMIIDHDNGIFPF
jgi:hypothetical protein